MGPQKGTTDDLATLSELDETSLIEELHHRYKRNVIYVSICNHHKSSKFFNTFLFLFSNKMVVIRAGIHKLLVR